MTTVTALAPHRLGGPQRFRQPLLIAVVLGALVWWSAGQCGVNLGELGPALAKGVEVVGFFFPPDWRAWPELIEPALVTLLLAAVATPLGLVLSIGFGLAGARNLAPAWLRAPARGLIGVERALPELITLLLHVAARFRRRMGVFAAIVAFLVGADVFLEFKPWMLFTDFHYIVRLAAEMAPPNLALLWENESLRTSVAETIAMAFLGTLTGESVALALSFFAAANTAPHPAARAAVRALFQFERATPNLITALVLLVAVGFGPFAGFLALAIGCMGMFGKLFADAIEQADPSPAEAVAALLRAGCRSAATTTRRSST